MSRPAKDHDLFIDAKGQVADQEGDTQPAFSISRNHKAIWKSATQNWYLRFNVWPFRENPDYQGSIRKADGDETEFSFLLVQKDVDKGPYRMRLKGRFPYTVLADTLSGFLDASNGANTDIEGQTGPEVLGED